MPMLKYETLVLFLFFKHTKKHYERFLLINFSCLTLSSVLTKFQHNKSFVFQLGHELRIQEDKKKISIKIHKIALFSTF